MSCVKSVRPAQQHLVATSTTDTLVWFTDWMSAVALDDCVAVLKLANVSGNFRAQPAVQTAGVRGDKPDAGSVVGSQQTTTGEYFYSVSDFDIDALTVAKTLVRFGVACDISSSPGLGQADVSLELALRQCGKLLAPWSGHLVATSSDDQFVPITEWLPALGVVAFQGTLVISSLTGSFRILLTYRTATASPELPGAWDPTGRGSAYTADGEVNTGELTPTTTGKMWIQLGIRYDLTSGTLGQADVAALIGVRAS